MGLFDAKEHNGWDMIGGLVVGLIVGSCVAAQNDKKFRVIHTTPGYNNYDSDGSWDELERDENYDSPRRSREDYAFPRGRR